MRLTSYLLIICTQFFVYTGQAQERPDFVEAQMGFNKSSSSIPEMRCEWDKGLKQLNVHFNLIWQNFDESLHGGGFALNRSLNSNLLYPAANEGCTLQNIMGALYEEGHIKSSHLTLSFMGESCLEMLPRLNVGSIVVNFYEVPVAEGTGPLLRVLRLQIWDHFKSMSCE